MATLTTNWLQLAQTKVGTDDYGRNLYIRIYARYTELDVSNNRSKVQAQARSYFDNKYSSETDWILDRQSRGSVSATGLSTVSFEKSSNYTEYENILATTEGWITHEANGTKSITASANLVFPNWGWNATATATATLPTLHTPPALTITGIAERASLSGITTQIVENLSTKRFSLSYSFSDSATASSVKVYDTQGNLLQSTSSLGATTGTVDINLKGQTLAVTGTTTNFLIELKDSLNGITTVRTTNYTVIPYRTPNLIQTASSVKRNGQSSGKVNLTLSGTYYNGSVGSTTNTLTLKFAYWKVGTSEPAASSYITIPSSANKGSGGNISIPNWTMEKNGAIITDVDKRYNYNFKIQAFDSFNTSNPNSILLVCPSGEYLWCEYADRVDFKKITVNNVDPFTIVSNEERIIGTWFGKPLYQKTIQETTSATDTRYSPSRYGISNIKECMFDYAHSFVHYKSGTPMIYREGMACMSLNTFLLTNDFKAFYLDGAGNFTFKSGNSDEVKWTITLMYTKTTD